MKTRETRCRSRCHSTGLRRDACGMRPPWTFPAVPAASNLEAADESFAYARHPGGAASLDMRTNLVHFGAVASTPLHGASFLGARGGAMRFSKCWGLRVDRRCSYRSHRVWRSPGGVSTPGGRHGVGGGGQEGAAMPPVGQAHTCLSTSRARAGKLSIVTLTALV